MNPAKFERNRAQASPSGLTFRRTERKRAGRSKWIHHEAALGAEREFRDGPIYDFFLRPGASPARPPR